MGRCSSSLSSSPSTASLSGSGVSSGAASPGEGERAGGPHVSTPDRGDPTPAALLSYGGMAAATVVSPVSLAAQTLRRLVRPHLRLRLNVRTPILYTKVSHKGYVAARLSMQVGWLVLHHLGHL